MPSAPMPVASLVRDHFIKNIAQGEGESASANAAA
jgi:hypothetical protein